jgi:glycosyltransferase 2 family protein
VTGVGSESRLARLARWSRREWRLLAGLGLSVVCLYLAVRGLSLPALRGALGAAQWQWVGLVAVTTVAGTLFKALRWQALFLPARVRLGRTWSIFLIGQMLNAVLPARAGEIGRIYYIGAAEKVSRSRALSTVVIEKMVDLIMLAVCYLVVAAWLTTAPEGVQDWLQAAGVSFLPLAGLALAGLLLFAYAGRPTWRLARRLLRFLPSGGRRPWREIIDATAEQAISAFEAQRQSRVILRVWSYSLVIWLLAALSNVLMFRAFELSLSAHVALLLLVVLMSGVAVPPLPGNLGVFPYLCQLVLSLFGVHRETGLIFGLVLQAASYLPVIILGLACLLRENAALRRSPGQQGRDVLPVVGQQEND